MTSILTRKNDPGIALGLAAYLCALGSWPLEHLLGSHIFVVYSTIPALPWLACVAGVTVYGRRPLRQYWWVLPSVLFALHWWFVGGLMMLAWSLGGFV